MLGAHVGLSLALLVLGAEPDASVEELVQRPEPVQWDLGLRTEFRAGRPESATSGPTQSLVDLELDPVAAVRVPFRLGSITAGYEPRVFMVLRETPAEPGRRVSYLNRGRLVLDLNPGPRLRLFVNARGAYGDFDFLPLSTVTTQTGSTGTPPATGGTSSTPTAPTPGAGPSTLPATRFLRIVDLDGSAGLTWSISPSTRWLFSGGYTYAGGANADARKTLPLQQGPKASTGLLWSASPNDDWAFLLDASRSDFDFGPESTVRGPRATLGNLTATWTHVWSRSVATDVVGGAGAFRSLRPQAGQPTLVTDDVLPVGGFGLRHAWLTRTFTLRNALTFLAAPLPDRINGAVYERLSGVAHSTLEPVPHVLFDATGGVTKTISTEQRDVRLEGKVTWQVVPELGVSAGGRVAWIGGSNIVSGGFGWLAFVAVGTFAGTPLIPTSI